MTRGSSLADALAAAEAILSAKWAIPVIRVLAEGPARFSGIRAAIPMVSANILAGRLRHLEEAGILRKTMLPPPADCQVYALTDIGEATRPILQAIGQWASLFHRGLELPRTCGPQDCGSPAAGASPPQSPSSRK